MSGYRTTFETLEHALTEALYLALTAPDEASSREAGRLAEEIAAELEPAVVELCKAHALERFEATP